MPVKRLLFLLVTATAFFCLFLLLSSNKYDINQVFSVTHCVSRRNVTVSGENLKISIVVVVTSKNTSLYLRALDSLRCYSQIQGYKLIIAVDTDWKKECKQKDKFFRRHCVVAQYLKDCDYLLFLDADMGVVNPVRKIEEFVNPKFDVTFYDRFYNQEIVAGAYLLKNSTYALDFIKSFADFETKLPNSFHGTDNGALHSYVLLKLYPDQFDDYEYCLEVYNMSKGYDELFAYEACVRAIIGINEEVQNIRFIRKGNGWARDGWLTNSLWSPEKDFMLHGWKTKQLAKYKTKDLPLKPTNFRRSNWYDPIVGDFDFKKCVPGNVSWNHDVNLIATPELIDDALNKYKHLVDMDKFRRLGKIQKLLTL